MKNVLMLTKMLVILLQCLVSLTVKGQNPVKQGSTNYKQESRMAVIDSLKQEIFFSSPDIIKVKGLLKLIREDGDTSLIDSVKAIHVEVQKNIYNGPEKKTDPFKSITYEVEATIISLTLKKINITSLNEKTVYLFKLVENKINLKGVSNAEAILLKEIATPITNDLLHIIDKNPDQNVKIFAISILKNSNASIVEKEILKRIDNYNNNFTLYAHMLSLLAEKGGIETFTYLSKKTNSKSSAIRTTVILSLKALGEKTKDLQLKEKINKTINH